MKKTGVGIIEAEFIIVNKKIYYFMKMIGNDIIEF